MNGLFQIIWEKKFHRMILFWIQAIILMFLNNCRIYLSLPISIYTNVIFQKNAFAWRRYIGDPVQQVNVDLINRQILVLSLPILHLVLSFIYGLWIMESLLYLLIRRSWLLFIFEDINNSYVTLVVTLVIPSFRLAA